MEISESEAQRTGKYHRLTGARPAGFLHSGFRYAPPLIHSPRRALCSFFAQLFFSKLCLTSLTNVQFIIFQKKSEIIRRNPRFALDRRTIFVYNRYEMVKEALVRSKNRHFRRIGYRIFPEFLCPEEPGTDLEKYLLYICIRSLIYKLNYDFFRCLRLV